jgi:hypothetical protein
LRCHGLVVGPQRDHKALPLIHPWLHSRLNSSHRTTGFDEPLSKLEFERCDLLRYRCHPGQDVTRQQTQGEPVRIMKNDRLIGCQAK